METLGPAADHSAAIHPTIRGAGEAAGVGVGGDAGVRVRRTPVRARREPSRPPVIARGGSTCLAPALAPPPALRLLDATGSDRLVEGYRRLRARAFVEQQGLFDVHDLDDWDDHARTRVLVVVDARGDVAGGVRVHPAREGAERLGWWRGSRLVARQASGAEAGLIGAELVRAACRTVQEEGVLRFDAHVQERVARFFTRLGWERTGILDVAGAPHARMRWPVDRFSALAARAKSPIGRIAGGLVPSFGPLAPWRGDDGVPVPRLPGAIACTDAILPSMVERDPEWAGWCGMLVTAHDLSAMGAEPVGALDAIGARDEATLARVATGLAAGAEMLDLPIIGGHTQVGVAAALTVTGLGRTEHPVPSGGGRIGDAISLSADLGGDWRPGYGHTQWDSSTCRTREEMRAMLGAVARARPKAAKDVSMAGIVGTIGMLAESSGAGAEVDVASLPRPEHAALADWLTCFPGFAMATADAATAPPLGAGPAVSARVGRLTGARGVRLTWPDGEVTEALAGDVTGLGAAAGHESSNDEQALGWAAEARSRT